MAFLLLVLAVGATAQYYEQQLPPQDILMPTILPQPPPPCQIDQTQPFPTLLAQDTRSLLEPYVRHYIDTLNKALFDQMGAFYDKNAVLVETDKSVLWGQKNIEDSLRAMTTEFGKTTMSVSNESFRGTVEFPVYAADFIYHAESRTLKGHYQQIWKEQNGRYVIYHDEYNMA